MHELVREALEYELKSYRDALGSAEHKAAQYTDALNNANKDVAGLTARIAALEAALAER